MFTLKLNENIKVYEGESINAEVIASKSEKIIWYINDKKIQV